MSFRLKRRMTREQLLEQLRREAREGLTASPKRMRSRWVWDGRGSDLYGRIMELPQYYLPQAEREILAARAPEIEALVHPRTVVELGPGSSVKTPLLLDALSGLDRYVAVDVSGEALEAAGGHLAARYPELEIVGVVGDFETGLPEPYERTLVVSLGSTIGGLDPEDRAVLLSAVAPMLGKDGALLLGLDLMKDVARIVAAYNDEQGLSAALIGNLLPILNRELDADFDPERFQGEAVWSEERGRMEMFVRSLESQTVTLGEIDLTVEFAEGETLRTEISTKFTREGVAAELATARMEVRSWWTDEAGDFALCLAQKRNTRSRRALSSSASKSVRMLPRSRAASIDREGLLVVASSGQRFSATAAWTSSPARSIVWKGPIAAQRAPRPAVTARSTSSKEQTPASTSA